MSLLRPRLVHRANITPTVTVIITAYKKSAILQVSWKTLSTRYPRELLDVIVASDCSSDRTDDIAREFAGRKVRLHRQTGGWGKTAAQNAAVEQATGEIVLFPMLRLFIT